MKSSTCLGLVFLLLTGAAALRADEASKMAKVEEFFELSRLQQTMGQLMELVRKQTDSRMLEQISGKTIPPDLRQDLDRYQDEIYAVLEEALGWDSMKADYIRTYADAFSEQDLDGIVAFYRSPAGKSLVEKTPQLMQEASKISQKRMAIAAPKLQELSRKWEALLAERSRQRTEGEKPPNP